MYRLRLKASAFAMSYLSSEEKVRAQVRALCANTEKPAPFIGAGGIKASAVRFSIIRYKNLRDCVSHFNEYVSAAAASGSQIVAFPELCGMTAVSLIPGFSTLLNDFKNLQNGPLESRAEIMRVFCETVQGFIGEIFHNTFSQLAQNHRIIIAAGGFYQVEDGRLYNRQFLFSETGEVAAIQDKIFLSEWEELVGVSPGLRITPGDTRIGRIALLEGGCLSHYEPFWIAASSGCSIAISGQSPFLDSNLTLARFRAQEQGLCIISPGLVDSAAYGLAVNTPAGIYAPRAATRSRDASPPKP